MLVTSSVWAEVTRKPREDEAARLSAAAEANFLRVVPDPETLPASLLRAGIDAGERGTLGLLVRAREEGFIVKLRPLVERLQTTGYFMPSRLVAKALASLGE